MSHIIKYKCNSSTYFDNNSSTSFLHDDAIYSGLINNSRHGLNMYYSILNFNIDNLKYHMIKKISLYLFVDTIKFPGTSPADIGLCCNDDFADISNYNHNTLSNYNFTNVTPLHIPENALKSYIQINITDILKSLIKSDGNYNFLFCPLDNHQSTIFKFGSASSSKPPYIKITFEEPSILNENNTDNRNKEDTIEPDFQDINSLSNPQKNIISHEKITNESDNKLRSSNNLSPSSKTVKHQNKTNTMASSISEILLYLSEQSKALSLLQELIQKKYDNPALEDINTKLNNLEESKKFMIEISHNTDSLSNILNYIKSKIDTTASADDMNSANERISNMISCININSLTDTLNEFINNFTEYNTEFTTIKNKISNISSMEDLDIVNKHIFNLAENIELQNNSLSSLKDEIDKKLDTNSSIILSIKNSLSDNMCTNEDFSNITAKLTELHHSIDDLKYTYDNIDKNLTNHITDINTDLYKNMIKTIYDNTSSYNDILNSINTSITNIHSSSDMTIITEIINQLNQTTNEIEKSNSDFYYSVAESFANINSRLSEFENYNKKVDNLCNFNITISDSIIDLQNNMQNLIKDISTINKYQNNLQKEYDSIKSLNTNFDSITQQLDAIKSTLDEVATRISSLTIEPLN